MTARTGMADLITELRGFVEAGTADYSIVGSAGTTNYWDDTQLQNILDIHRTDVIFEQLQMYPTYVSSGSLSYQDYRSSFGYFEATSGGTAIFYVQDSTGSTVGSSSYTPDYRRGVVLFGSDQVGTVYYLTGRSYDLPAAAADIWRRKAAHLASSSFDFSTDNHSVKRSQLVDYALKMAEYWEGMSGNSIEMVDMYRGDIDNPLYQDYD